MNKLNECCLFDCEIKSGMLW